MWVPPFCCPATARLFPTKSGKWTPSRWSLQEVRKEKSEEEEGFHTGEQARVTLAACGVCEARDWGRKGVGWAARQAGANRLLESRQIKALASGSDSGDLGRSVGCRERGTTMKPAPGGSLLAQGLAWGAGEALLRAQKLPPQFRVCA